ncbi:hypothetical protein ACFL1E_05040 [Candidatus Omnitrophota bacterium]
MMKNKTVLLLFVSFCFVCLGLCPSLLFAQPKNSALALPQRRDPFVSLIDETGRLKDIADLFPPRGQVLPIKVELKGILWDEEHPLAVLEKKIVSEGENLGGGVILEKIAEDHIILNFEGEQFTVKLRKKGAKK